MRLGIFILILDRSRLTQGPSKQEDLNLMLLLCLKEDKKVPPGKIYVTSSVENTRYFLNRVGFVVCQAFSR